MARLSFRCDDELVARVDEARGRVPRERWLRDAVERELANVTEARKIADRPVRPLAYRQVPNVENIRSSSQVKAGVEPISKGRKR